MELFKDMNGALPSDICPEEKLLILANAYDQALCGKHQSCPSTQPTSLSFSNVTYLTVLWCA